MSGSGARNRRREKRAAEQGVIRFVETQYPEQNFEILSCGHFHKYIPRITRVPGKNPRTIGKLPRHCLFCSMEQNTG